MYVMTGEAWVALLEKGLMKLYDGDYSAVFGQDLKNGLVCNSGDCLRELTGEYVINFDLTAGQLLSTKSSTVNLPADTLAKISGDHSQQYYDEDIHDNAQAVVLYHYVYLRCTARSLVLCLDQPTCSTHTYPDQCHVCEYKKNYIVKEEGADETGSLVHNDKDVSSRTSSPGSRQRKSLGSKSRPSVGRKSGRSSLVKPPAPPTDIETVTKVIKYAVKIGYFTTMHNVNGTIVPAVKYEWIDWCDLLLRYKCLSIVHLTLMQTNNILRRQVWWVCMCSLGMYVLLYIVNYIHVTMVTYLTI